MAFTGVITIMDEGREPMVFVTGPRDDQQNALRAAGTKAAEVLTFRRLFAEHGQDMNSTQHAAERLKNGASYASFTNGDGDDAWVRVGVAELIDNVRPL